VLFSRSSLFFAAGALREYRFGRGVHLYFFARCAMMSQASRRFLSWHLDA
jgi:hypothetical protein